MHDVVALLERRREEPMREEGEGTLLWWCGSKESVRSVVRFVTLAVVLDEVHDSQALERWVCFGFRDLATVHGLVTLDVETRHFSPEVELAKSGPPNKEVSLRVLPRRAALSAHVDLKVDGKGPWNCPVPDTRSCFGPLPLLWVALAALTAKARDTSSASVSAASNFFMPSSSFVVPHGPACYVCYALRATYRTSENAPSRYLGE